MEVILNRGLPYISGPQWLKEHVLMKKWVLAVSGTHGKTTTSAMLAWILEYAGYQPGYLIGGVPGNFQCSAAIGQSDFFVIEADEYDTAFFDKRAKFNHYQPNTLIINNLEFDHADIYDDLSAIQKQFHHLLRIVPEDGHIIIPHDVEAISDVLAMGCWSSVSTVHHDWRVEGATDACDAFTVINPNQEKATLRWSLTGQHNLNNAVAAIAAAHHVGVPMAVAVQALSTFLGVKRRMELLIETKRCRLFDDFAHHPTAIASTLSGLRAQVGPSANILAIIEPRSNTMKQGIHQDQLNEAVTSATHAFWFEPQDLDWCLSEVVNGSVYNELGALIEGVIARIQPNTHIVIMSNGGFQGIHQKLTQRIQEVDDARE